MSGAEASPAEATRPGRRLAPKLDATPTTYTRRLLVVAASLVVIGLGMVGTGSTEEGRVFALEGVGLLIWGVHNFGRLGPDDEIDARQSSEADRRGRALQAAELAVGDGVIIGLIGVAIAASARMFAQEHEAGGGVAAYCAIAVGAYRAYRGLDARRALRP